MKEKVIRSGLLVVIVCLFAFVASYSAFFMYKEKACQKSLYSQDCYRDYEGFLIKYL